MKFWKEHTRLRCTLIALFFFAGLGMVIGGWTMTGRLSGLGVMLAGVALLLASLMIYNRAFESDRDSRL